MESAEERAYRSIIRKIFHGVYNPGDFLLEIDLAPELNMSRTPVSRALSRLVSEGFLKKMPKKGCFIPIPTPQEAACVFAARQLAEGEATALAAVNAAPEDIIALEGIVERDAVAMVSKNKEEWASVNEDFHLYICKLSSNPYIEKFAKNMFMQSNLFIFYFDGFYKNSEIVIEHKTPIQHREILNAIKSREVEKARSLMREHIYTTYSKLLLPINFI